MMRRQMRMPIAMVLCLFAAGCCDERTEVSLGRMKNVDRKPGGFQTCAITTITTDTTIFMLPCDGMPSRPIPIDAEIFQGRDSCGGVWYRTEKFGRFYPSSGDWI